MNPKKTCATCEHLGKEANPKNLREPFLTCRAHPPAPVVTTQGVASSFPPTRAEWACGEWTPGKV